VSEIAFKRARGVVYRATTYDTCLWVSPNSRSGRWNDPQADTIAQYCTLDVASALAEMVRSENLREVEDARELTVSVWELRIDEGAVVDYSTPSHAEIQGFEWSALVSDQWEPCQTEARRLIAEGARGVIGPSAALPRGVTLTLFGPRTEIAWSAEPTLSIQIPARHILRGAPGDGLVRDTRFFDEAYPDVTTRDAQGLFNLDLNAERRIS
jgi:RES domain-containing protein